MICHYILLTIPLTKILVIHGETHDETKDFFFEKNENL